MKIIVCGGRDYTNRERVYAVLDRWLDANQYQGCTLISGACPTGVDSFAEDWFYERHLPVERYPADWDRYGRSAGPRRNQKMLDEGRPWRVIAFPGNDGTANMKKIARRARVKVFEIPW